MKNATLYYLLGASLLSASSCTKDADPGVELPSVPCALTSSYAKPIADLEGLIRFDQVLQQYVVWRAIPGTYDSVDIGVVCGDLPSYLKTAGTKVRFSGIYRGQGQPAPSSPAGTTYYYLELSKIATL
ncbi:hypothetical protein FNT36_11490 [Hymenobacter setariae]|uniref:Uncharacterized protein n=1 Tax=Hymenobacter setariae TaxID=2594794 RepID=A0A558BUD4_9BACT|nr:hypothetical protein [Hymenobacter setariae]TVT40115.1 hypothetical protein FNT36_11490 [Hymenobacter setariae]